MIYVNARFLTQYMTGVQRFAVEICLELKKRYGDEIRFVAPNAIVMNDYAEALDVEIIGTHKGHYWEQLDLPRYLRKHGNPLLLCLCNTAPICYKNKVVTIHDVAFEAYPQTFKKTFLYSYKILIPAILRTSKHIITVSEFSRKEINKYYGINIDNISVVFSSQSSDFKFEFDEELAKCSYFLAVSSLNYRKNFQSILKSFVLFREQNQDVDLYIIGDIEGNNFASLDIKQYLNNPNIKFIGRISDEALVKYYSNAAGFIFPSLYEGFGLPPLEAQACHCPVLCSDIPPHHEVVSDSAIYCNPNDINDIVEKMGVVLKEHDLLVDKGIENIKRFSFEKSAGQLVEIMDKILL